MIAGFIHPGSGVGNQLHRYVMTRVLAADHNVPYGFIGTEFLKTKDFMSLDTGEEVPGVYAVSEGGKIVAQTPLRRFEEKRVEENGVDVRGYDPEINFIEDNTLIDGEFQDQRYFIHRMDDVRRWLHTQHLGMPNDVCVLGFRGGEFATIPDLFLPKEYWETAMAKMREINPNMKFYAVTDDPWLAAEHLPSEVRIFHDVATDWRMVRNASYLIISNSSFYILPSLLNEHARLIIAPRYWARRNTGVWCLPSNYYPKFLYL